MTEYFDISKWREMFYIPSVAQSMSMAFYFGHLYQANSNDQIEKDLFWQVYGVNIFTMLSQITMLLSMLSIVLQRGWKWVIKWKKKCFLPYCSLKNMEIFIFIPSGYKWYHAVVRCRSQLITLVTEHPLREWGLNRKMSITPFGQL